MHNISRVTGKYKKLYMNIGLYTVLKYCFNKSQSQSSKRPMGHIALMRNQFKSKDTFVQSYDYIIILIGRGKNLFLNQIVLICKPWVTFTQGCLMPSLVEDFKILILLMYFCYFILISPWNKRIMGHIVHLRNQSKSILKHSCSEL